MKVSNSVQDPPLLLHLLPWSLDNVISLRMAYPFTFRAGRETSDHLAVSIHFTNRKVRFKEAMSFAQGPQPVSSGDEGRTQLPSPTTLCRQARDLVLALGAGKPHLSGSQPHCLETERRCLSVVLMLCSTLGFWGPKGEAGGLASERGAGYSPCFQQSGSFSVGSPETVRLNQGFHG